MITISHSHADGTILAGSRKGDGVYDIVKSHGFRYSRHVGIYLRGSRDRDAQRTRIDAAADALRGAGFDVTVEIDDRWRPAADREAARGDRADDRAERFDQRAGHAAGRRDARHAAARRVLDGIPAGQPMMPDHHSYAADRHRRERAWANMDQAMVEDRTAGNLADRADGVRANEEAKDDPRAIMRRIERLQADLRLRERQLADAERSGESGADGGRLRREIERLTEDIGHQQSKLAQRATSGQFVAWSPDNVTVGDRVRVGSFGWYRVVRVNRKSVSLDTTSWPKRTTFDQIFGRRRRGQQWDTPNGDPWPVDLATRVYRWRRLASAARNPGYDPEQQRQARHVGYARRLVHGLDLTAGDPQVAAFWPDDNDPSTVADRRRLMAAYLAVFDQLHAGELVPDIAASLVVDPHKPVWAMPTGDPVDRHPQDLHPGDIVAGLWDRGHAGRRLWPQFAGPVSHVSPVEHRRERGDWVTVTLTDGTARDIATHQWLAVHPSTAT